MRINAVAYDLNLSDVERRLLSSTIEYWFMTAYETENRLFGDMDKSIQLLDVVKQIKDGAISVRISKYQAKIVSDVIYNKNRLMNPKTWKEYLREDFPLRGLYDELVELAK